MARILSLFYLFFPWHTSLAYFLLNLAYILHKRNYKILSFLNEWKHFEMINKFYYCLLFTNSLNNLQIKELHNAYTDKNNLDTPNNLYQNFLEFLQILKLFIFIATETDLDHYQLTLNTGLR